MTVGFFAQHQVEELDAGETPFRAIAARMREAPESRIRGRCARMGFPGQKADTAVAQLSGGEKARLMMGLATFDGPHLLILDEPTNHLDIDSRAALIEAVNDYQGAIILISHDRYLIDACADRLWLVDEGTVQAFDGDMDEYKALVLERAGGAKRAARKGAPAADTAEPAPPKKPGRGHIPLRKQVETLEERMAKFQKLIARIDEALANPDTFRRDKGKAATLAQQRKECERALTAAEEEWLALSAELEAAP